MNSGYTPGPVVVYQGTLFLPIVNGLTPIDVLTCKLDATDRAGRRTFPWTRISGTLPLATVVSPHTGKMLGGSAAFPRLATLDYLDRSLSTTDADGSLWATKLQTRSAVPPNDRSTLVKVRLGYQQNGGGATTANYESDITTPVLLSGSAGGNTATRRAPFTWRVGKPARYSAINITQNLQPSVFTVKSFEWFIRQSGRA